MRKFEKDLLMEAEGLKALVTLFNVYLDEFDRIKKEYGEYFDHHLYTVLLYLEVKLAVLLEKEFVIKKENLTIPGIVKQLDDVMDEIQTFQAGLETKRGIPDEDVNNDTGVQKSTPKPPPTRQRKKR